MSRDQRPAKVKVYSGAGAKPGAPAASPERRSGTAQTAMSSSSAAGGAVVAASLAGGETTDGKTPWLVALLFVLGCAIGGGLFTFVLGL